MLVQSLGWEGPLEEEMATHSSILAWKAPWTEEPGGLQSMGSQSQTRVNDYTTFLYQIYDSSDNTEVKKANVKSLLLKTSVWKRKI